MKSDVMVAIITGVFTGLATAFATKTQTDCVESVASKAMKNGYNCKITQDAKNQNLIIDLNPTEYTQYKQNQIVITPEMMDQLVHFYIMYQQCVKQLTEMACQQLEASKTQPQSV